MASCWQQLLFAKGCHHLQNLLFVRRLFYLPVLQVAFKISNPEKRSSEFFYFSQAIFLKILMQVHSKSFSIFYIDFSRSCSREQRFHVGKNMFVSSLGETLTARFEINFQVL